MLIRRLLASVIHNQKRRSLTSPAASAFVSSSSNKSPKTVENISPATRSSRQQQGTSRSSSTPFLRKLLQQTLQILLFGRRKDNVLLANTSLNRALKYTGLEMSSTSRGRTAHKAADKQEEEEEEIPTSSPTRSENKRDNNSNTWSQSIEELDEPGSLDDLRESYVAARKKSANCWLDYSNKSCYIYLHRGGGEPSESIAAFDLDGTLIRPKSNKRIPRSATDWDFFSVWTKVKLQQCLRDSRARFVIFTNQNGIGLNIVPLDEVQKRIELVTKRLDIPCTVFMAVEKDEFRKPRTGMFQLFDHSFNDSIPLNHESSFYCGDAIGYPSHSDADIKFAQKLNLPFLTPEKFVRGVKPKLVT